MGFFSKFEGKVDDAMDGMASSVFKSPIEPSQIAKKCEKEMTRNKLVGKGVQYAPTLYTVLVNVNDDKRLFGFYPTMAGEIETYLVGAAGDANLTLECRPLVRFIADEGLKSGKFHVIAEVVTQHIIAELREEEAEYYGLDSFAKGSREAIPTRNPNPRPGGTTRRSESSAHVAGAPVELAGNSGIHDFSGLDNIGSSAAAGAAGAAGAAAGAAGASAGGAHVRKSPASSADAELGGGGQADAYGNAYDDQYADSYDDPYNDPYNDQYSDPYADRFADSGSQAVPDYTMVAGAGAVAASSNRNAGYGFQGVLENARTGERISLEYRNMLVGRESHCDICIPDSSVSRNHARLVMDDMGNWTIEDLGSTNGTKVNGHQVRQAELRFGDQITFGTTVMIFQKG